MKTDPAALMLLTLGATQIEEVLRGDFFDHVREEIEVSRQQLPDILRPGLTLFAAADKLMEELHRSFPGTAGQCAIRQRAAELIAIAARLALEGSPAFPGSLPNQKPDLRQRAAR